MAKSGILSVVEVRVDVLPVDNIDNSSSLLVEVVAFIAMQEKGSQRLAQVLIFQDGERRNVSVKHVLIGVDEQRYLVGSGYVSIARVRKVISVGRVLGKDEDGVREVRSLRVVAIVPAKVMGLVREGTKGDGKKLANFTIKDRERVVVLEVDY